MANIKRKKRKSNNLKKLSAISATVFSGLLLSFIAVNNASSLFDMRAVEQSVAFARGSKEAGPVNIAKIVEGAADDFESGAASNKSIRNQVVLRSGSQDLFGNIIYQDGMTIKDNVYVKSEARSDVVRTVSSRGVGSSTGFEDIFRAFVNDRISADYVKQSETELGIDDEVWLQGEVMKLMQQSIDNERETLIEWLSKTDSSFSDEKLSEYIESEPDTEGLIRIANRLMIQLERTEVADMSLDAQVGWIAARMTDWFAYSQCASPKIKDGKVISHAKYELMYDGDTMLLEQYPDLDLVVSEDEIDASIDKFNLQSELVYKAVYQNYAMSLPGALEDIKVASPLDVSDLEAYITSEFGSRGDIYFNGTNLKNHTGTDFGMARGTTIKAAQSGIVVKTANLTYGYGNYLILDHNGYQTLYAHCSKLLVEPGDLVRIGDPIAEIGSTGWSTGPHLHFEVIYNNTPLNAMAFLQYRMDPSQLLVTDAAGNPIDFTKQVKEGIGAGDENSGNSEGVDDEIGDAEGVEILDGDVILKIEELKNSGGSEESGGSSVSTGDPVNTVEEGTDSSSYDSDAIDEGSAGSKDTDSLDNPDDSSKDSNVDAHVPDKSADVSDEVVETSSSGTTGGISDSEVSAPDVEVVSSPEVVDSFVLGGSEPDVSVKIS